MNDSRAYTKEEMRDMFICNLKANIREWSRFNVSEKEKLEGLLFSTLNMLDGMSGGFPCAVDLVLRPHPEDKEFSINEGEKWVEDGMVINDDCMLHEIFIQN